MHIVPIISNNIIRFRWPILLFSVCLVALATTGVKNLYFSNSYHDFFKPDNPDLLAFEELENTYSKNDNVIIVLEPANGDIFTQDNLSIIKELTEASWQVPYSIRVDSITNFQHTEALEDDLSVADLVLEPNTLSTAELEKIRDIAIMEPVLVNRLISPNSRITGINVTVQLPGLDQGKEAPEVAKFVRQMTAEIMASRPDINVYLAGIIMMNNGFSELTLADMNSLIPMSFVIMFLILALIAGGISGTFSTFLVTVASTLPTMGIAGYLGIPLSSPTSIVPIIILTVAVANCVHILISFKHGMQDGLDKHGAIKESLRINMQPVALASLTTAIGFLALNFSETPPFRDLGNMVAMGVIFSLILSVSFMPALMSLLPVRIKPGSHYDTNLMTTISDFVIEHKRKLFWVMTILILLMMSGIPRNELNDVFIHYFDKSVQLRIDSDFTAENLTGVTTLDYTLQSGEVGGISEPQFLRETDAFVDWLKKQPEVIHVNTITDIMRRLNKSMHGDDPSAYVLPEDRELAAQYLLLYELSLPYGLDLNNQVDIEKSATRLTVTLETLSSKELIDVDERVLAWLGAYAPHIKTNSGSGPPMMMGKLGQKNIISMIWGLSLAVLLISLILIIAFRSIKYGLLSLIPNMVPILIGFGLWGFIVGEIGLSVSVVASMSLGIVIDDTVHFLSKYLRARREQKMGDEDAVRYAFKTVGEALIATSVILATGFFIISTSHFYLNESMGLLTAIVIILALIIDFLLLPVILMNPFKKHETVAGSI